MDSIPNLIRLDRHGTALVIIDLQEKLARAIDDGVTERVIRNTRILAQAAQILELPVLVTEQYPAGLGTTVGELGSTLAEMAMVLEKVEFDATRNHDFSQQLADLGPRNVVLTGLETHICIWQTALGLAAQNYNVWVASDAVASRCKHNHRDGLAMLRQAGILVAPTESILFSILGRAGTPEFKEIAPLIR